MFTSRKIPAKSARRLQGFTLVEVTLAIIILMLLVGVLCAIVDTTLRAASELEERQNRNREINAFLSLCRKTLTGMPGSVTFQARVVQDGNTSCPELIFRNAPGLMGWGDANNTSLSTILGVRGQVGGLVGIGILQDSEERITSYLNGGKPERQWLMLLPDLREASWRFFDATSMTWQKEWINRPTRPELAELTLTTTEGTRVYSFWMPPVTQIQAAAP